MSTLQSYREREGMICLKINERRAHNLELGKLPEMLASVRNKINREEMYIATGNVGFLGDPNKPFSYQVK